MRSPANAIGGRYHACAITSSALRGYIVMHAEARLSAAEREQLARGLDASIRGTQATTAD